MDHGWGETRLYAGPLFTFSVVNNDFNDRNQGSNYFYEEILDRYTEVFCTPCLNYPPTQNFVQKKGENRNRTPMPTPVRTLEMQ